MEFGQKFVYTTFFKNDLLQSTGDHFQQIFNRLMQEAHHNFQKIEVQGSKGDRKCDGFLEGDGVFYQVYGPKDYDTNMTSLTTAISKIEEDFLGLKSHIESGYWEDIKEYVFVFKTHRGSYPDLIEKKKKLERDFPNIDFNIYDIDSLLSIFSKLSDGSISLVSNTYIPEPDFNFVSYEVMGDIIKHLISIGASSNIDVTKTPPDFNKKIEFNKLCEFYSMNLRVASYSIPKVEDYLSSYSDPGIGDFLSGLFKNLYSMAKSEYPNNSDLQFKYILEGCRHPSTPLAQLSVFETNSYILMSKYFETCDIFVEPPSSS